MLLRWSFHRRYNISNNIKMAGRSLANKNWYPTAATPRQLKTSCWCQAEQVLGWRATSSTWLGKLVQLMAAARCGDGTALLCVASRLLSGEKKRKRITSQFQGNFFLFKLFRSRIQYSPRDPEMSMFTESTNSAHSCPSSSFLGWHSHGF